VLAGKGSLRRANLARPCRLRAVLIQKAIATGGSGGNTTTSYGQKTVWPTPYNLRNSLEKLF
jgi:hypothetical protein